MKRFVIGDIHGRINALKKVLKDSEFNKEEDCLIVLGDIVDGGYNTDMVLEELLTIKNVVFITGNHDQWFIDYTFRGRTPLEWINQGGANTLNSYGGKVIPANRMHEEPIMIDINGVKIPKKHVEFFANRLYYFEYDEMLFVHGGFDPKKPISEQKHEKLMWDRDLIDIAGQSNIPGYKKVFIGHTTTQHIEREWVNFKCRDCKHEWSKEIKSFADLRKTKEDQICEKCKSTNIFQTLGCINPIKIGNLYCLDTGAGWSGRLTLMDIDTEKFWQSEIHEPPINKKQ